MRANRQLKFDDPCNCGHTREFHFAAKECEVRGCSCQKFRLDPKSDAAIKPATNTQKETRES